MREQAYWILRTPEFRDWYEQQTEKAKVQIDGRLSKIQDEGYFGDRKSVSEKSEIWELRWKMEEESIFLIPPKRKS